MWREEEIKAAAGEGIIAVDEIDWPLFRELGKYWETRCSEYIQSKLYDERIFRYLQLGITLPPMKRKDEFRGAYAGSGLCLSFAFTDCYADFSRWLNGLNPIILEAEEELRNLRFFNLDDVGKKLFLEAAIIVLKAVIRLADRYAEAAEALAENEGNTRRKEELRAW